MWNVFAWIGLGWVCSVVVLAIVFLGVIWLIQPDPADSEPQRWRSSSVLLLLALATSAFAQPRPHKVWAFWCGPPADQNCAECLVIDGQLDEAHGCTVDPDGPTGWALSNRDRRRPIYYFLNSVTRHPVAVYRPTAVINPCPDCD